VPAFVGTVDAAAEITTRKSAAARALGADRCAF
jgi:hypothetical protein